MKITASELFILVALASLLLGQTSGGCSDTGGELAPPTIPDPGGGGGGDPGSGGDPGGGEGDVGDDGEEGDTAEVGHGPALVPNPQTLEENLTKEFPGANQFHGGLF